jgi:hypothetical protein
MSLKGTVPISTERGLTVLALGEVQSTSEPSKLTGLLAGPYHSQTSRARQILPASMRAADIACLWEFRRCSALWSRRLAHDRSGKIRGLPKKHRRHSETSRATRFNKSFRHRVPVDQFRTYSALWSILFAHDALAQVEEETRPNQEAPTAQPDVLPLCSLTAMTELDQWAHDLYITTTVYSAGKDSTSGIACLSSSSVYVLQRNCLHCLRDSGR